MKNIYWHQIVGILLMLCISTNFISCSSDEYNPLGQPEEKSNGGDSLIRNMIKILRLKLM